MGKKKVVDEVVELVLKKGQKETIETSQDLAREVLDLKEAQEKIEALERAAKTAKNRANLLDAEAKATRKLANKLQTDIVRLEKDLERLGKILDSQRALGNTAQTRFFRETERDFNEVNQQLTQTKNQLNELNVKAEELKIAIQEAEKEALEKNREAAKVWDETQDKTEDIDPFFKESPHIGPVTPTEIVEHLSLETARHDLLYKNFQDACAEVDVLQKRVAKDPDSKVAQADLKDAIVNLEETKKKLLNLPEENIWLVRAEEILDNSTLKLSAAERKAVVKVQKEFREVKEKYRPFYRQIQLEKAEAACTAAELAEAEAKKVFLTAQEEFSKVPYKTDEAVSAVQALERAKQALEEAHQKTVASRQQRQYWRHQVSEKNKRPHLKKTGHPAPNFKALKVYTPDEVNLLVRRLENEVAERDIAFAEIERLRILIREQNEIRLSGGEVDEARFLAAQEQLKEAKATLADKRRNVTECEENAREALTQVFPDYQSMIEGSLKASAEAFSRRAYPFYKEGLVEAEARIKAAWLVKEEARKAVANARSEHRELVNRWASPEEIEAAKEKIAKAREGFDEALKHLYTARHDIIYLRQRAKESGIILTGVAVGLTLAEEEANAQLAITQEKFKEARVEARLAREEEVLLKDQAQHRGVDWGQLSLISEAEERSRNAREVADRAKEAYVEARLTAWQARKEASFKRNREATTHVKQVLSAPTVWDNFLSRVGTGFETYDDLNHLFNSGNAEAEDALMDHVVIPVAQETVSLVHEEIVTTVDQISGETSKLDKVLDRTAKKRIIRDDIDLEDLSVHPSPIIIPGRNEILTDKTMTDFSPVKQLGQSKNRNGIWEAIEKNQSEEKNFTSLTEKNVSNEDDINLCIDNTLFSQRETHQPNL